jgi:hypothetical protein
MHSKPIQDLLDQKNTLSEIAALMYGDDYILHKEFWNSPTERELFQVWEQLDLLGYEEPITEEMQALGDLIFDDLVNKGIIPMDDEGEDDNDDE